MLFRSYEYNLIKESIEDEFCLNRALGKCTIWDEKLKEKVSNSVKNVWENSEYRESQKDKHKGELNAMYKLPSWENVNSDLKSWLKTPTIYLDYITENWDLNKYGYGRNYLVKRYDIKIGTARCLINKFRQGWNPMEDFEFNLFLEEQKKCSGAETGIQGGLKNL